MAKEKIECMYSEKTIKQQVVTQQSETNRNYATISYALSRPKEKSP
jgi:hypothetical protein